MIDADTLAQEIRRVDGNHSLGAGALAEALVPFIEAAIAVGTPPHQTGHVAQPSPITGYTSGGNGDDDGPSHAQDTCYDVDPVGLEVDTSHRRSDHCGVREDAGRDECGCEIEVATPAPSPQTEAKPFAWYWHDQHGCLYITGDDRKPDVPAGAKPLYEHPAPAPQDHALAPEDTAIATCEACGKHVQEGEPYLWGPETDLCGECAPTYQALIDEPEGFVNAEGEPLTPEQCRAWFDEHIAAGGKATDSIAKIDRAKPNPAPVTHVNARALPKLTKPQAALYERVKAERGLLRRELSAAGNRMAHKLADMKLIALDGTISSRGPYNQAAQNDQVWVLYEDMHPEHTPSPVSNELVLREALEKISDLVEDEASTFDDAIEIADAALALCPSPQPREVGSALENNQPAKYGESEV